MNANFTEVDNCTVVLLDSYEIHIDVFREKEKLNGKHEWMYC